MAIVWTNILDRERNVMEVIIINGAPRSGKDTFIRFLKELSGKTVTAYSSIDWVKSVSVHLGWDGKKDLRGRKFLSDIKDACTEYADTPFHKIIEKMQESQILGTEIFCTNIRESSEINKLVSYCDGVGIPCKAVLVRRIKAEEDSKGMTHTGDSQYMAGDYHCIVNNNSTLSRFRKNVECFLMGE